MGNENRRQPQQETDFAQGQPLKLVHYGSGTPAAEALSMIEGE
jgi:hypothetical protein